MESLEPQPWDIHCTLLLGPCQSRKSRPWPRAVLGDAGNTARCFLSPCPCRSYGRTIAEHYHPSREALMSGRGASCEKMGFSNMIVNPSSATTGTDRLDILGAHDQSYLSNDAEALAATILTSPPVDPGQN